MKGSSLFIFSAFSLFASTAPANTCPFEGIYAGINLGFIQSDEKINHTIALDGGVLVFNETPVIYQFSFFNTNPNQVSDTSILGMLTLGYSKRMLSWGLLGIEARIGLSDLNTPDIIVGFSDALQLINTQTTVELKQQYALAAKLGYVAGDRALFYGLIGPQLGHFKTHTDTDFRQTQGDRQGGEVLFQAANAIQSDKKSCGLLLGIGMEYWINCALTVGLEYNHTHYGNLKYPKNTLSKVFLNGNALPNSSFVDFHHIEMNTNAIMLKTAYYF